MKRRPLVIYSICALFIIALGVGIATTLFSSDSSKRQIADDAKFFKQIAKENPKLQHSDNIIFSHKLSESDRDGKVGLQLGNFIDGSSGLNLCSQFDRLGIRLRSEGYAVNGDPVRLTVELGCPGVDHKDPQYLLEVPLLNNEMCDSEPDGVVREAFNGVLTYIENYDSEFPTDWVLEDLTFYNQKNTAQTLGFDELKIRNILGEPLMISCPNLY